MHFEIRRRATSMTVTVGAHDSRSVQPARTRDHVCSWPIADIAILSKRLQLLARGFNRKLTPSRLIAFMAAMVKVKSTKSLSPKTASAAA